MANHKSAIKRIRQIQKRREHNRYYKKTMRNAVAELREISDKKEAEKRLPEVFGLIDKAAKRNMIHKNKAANLKSQLTKRVSSL